MTLLYKIGIFFYGLFIHIASSFNEKARLFVGGRKNWRKELSEKIIKGEKYIWFHCASLGEFEQGRPVIEAIKSRFPEYRIVLTFFSPSGYEVRKNYEKADVVSYLPLDTQRNVRTFIKTVQPKKAFFVKYDYWYFYISELKRNAIPLYIISAIFREKQFFFRKDFIGKWYRRMLFYAEHLFVQDEKSAVLLESVGIKNYTVSGDTRFDRVAAIAESAKEVPLVNKFKGDYPLIIAGSTWRPDEELLAAFIYKVEGVKIVFAPHEVTTSNINNLEKMLKKQAVRWSKAENADVTNAQVLIIDSVGLLSSLYRYGDVAYIGGGFGVGIHNILEAATFGLPVIFGPAYQKFKEAVDLKKAGGAFPVHNFQELETALSLLKDDKKRTQAAMICRKYVEKNTGSTKSIVKKVFNI